jgi:ankyrin repeat protein
MPAAQTGALLRHYVEHNNVEQVRLLLTKRSSPIEILDNTDCNGTTALHLAARHGTSINQSFDIFNTKFERKRIEP